jgi:G:T-mismatch repair DNA endonuclease (very short patch repair protein)
MNIAWNRGLRKDTDERVRRASEKMVGKKRTAIGCKNNSVTQKKRYATTEHPFKQAENEEKRRISLIGHAVSAETRKKLSRFRQGKSWEQLLGTAKAEQAQEKISLWAKGRRTWQTGLTKETHPSLMKLSNIMKSQHRTIPDALKKWQEENQQFLREWGRQYGAKYLQKYAQDHPEDGPRYLRKYILEHPEHQREASIKSCLKQNGFTSSIEKRVEQHLLQRNVMFEKQVKLLDICVVDFLLANGIPIFCDGCYWHACPDHHPEYTKQNFGARERDCFIVDQLIQNGYNPIRLWEHEIRNNDFSKLEAI